MAVKKVGILYHPMVEATRIKAGEAGNFLKSRNIVAWLCSAWDKDGAQAQLKGTDLILTVGGDGTILRAAQIVFTGTIPLVGINLGKLGFLTEINADEALKKLPALIGKKSWIDERAMIQAEVKSAGGKARIFQALNDVVVARGEIARIIRVEVTIDGQPLTTYKADGVILATATGSTGYALSAGGPVLYPQSADFLLVPVAAHLAPIHTLVLPPAAEVGLRVTAVHPATISIDGHINLPVSGGDTVTVKLSPYKVRFLRMSHDNAFYSSLEEKLKGNRSESGRKS